MFSPWRKAAFQEKTVLLFGCMWTFCLFGLLYVPHIHAAQKSRYVLLHEGQAVLDTATELVWRRCQEGKQWDGVFCKGIGKEMDWDEAQRISNKEWRVPTIEELKSLSQPPSADSGWIWIDPIYFPDTDPDTFWSSTPNDSYPEAAWDFNFRKGIAFFGANRTYRSYVRLVRKMSWRDALMRFTKFGSTSSPTPRSVNRYVLTADEQAVNDRRTGLLWRRCQEGKRFINGSCEGGPLHTTWYDAAKLGSDGWRLPSKGELKSLIELNASGDTTINQTAFPGTEPNEFWTQTPSDTNTSATWVVDFGNGYDSGNFVRFMRAHVRLARPTQQ